VNREPIANFNLFLITLFPTPLYKKYAKPKSDIN